MREIKKEVAIIGGGPAGCAAAIQLKRSTIEPVIFEGGEIGGLVRNANFIENYLGFPEGITVIDFAALLEIHLKQLKVEVIHSDISTIRWLEEYNKFELISADVKCVCNYLIIATGTLPKKLNVSNEKTLENLSLLFYEPIDLKEKNISKLKIAIIGAGDAAFDYALNLFQKTNQQITIFSKGDTFHCLPLLYERVIHSKKISIQKNKEVKEFILIDKDKLKKSAQINFSDGSSAIVDLVFVAIGREPNDFLLKTLPKNAKGFFVIGDINNQSFRQVSIAAGEGIRCAMEIIKMIKESHKFLK